ncbi:MAG: homocysteine biosynthesis protein [Firmicutes bacterium]|nr:homocysteine biosynthesis protein [Bacillota bacterium]
MKTYEEINQKIKQGKAVVVTAEEIIGLVRDEGYEAAARKVDVVTTATFGPMCSTGAFLNFGHSDPPIRMNKVWLNDVPAYAGIAAVDAYIGATEQSEIKGIKYGGAHVIEDLVSGKKVELKATSYGTDCYPRKEIRTMIGLQDMNQAYLFNPRNAYQNYPVAVNSSNRAIYTYMGTLLPNLGAATYSTAGELSPLLNDPYYRTIGIGTRIFLGGAVGYVAWEGTQHNPLQIRAENGVPVGGAGTLALTGDLKQMNREFLRAAIFDRYGITMYVGVGVPIPVLDVEMVKQTAVTNHDIKTTIIDYSVPRRSRPNYGQVSYAELRSGSITINGKKVPTAPLSSLAQARKIAVILKDWITKGQFTLTEPVQRLPMDNKLNTLEAWDEEVK